MPDEKNERIITEKQEREVPRTVTEQKTVQEPKTVMEKKTIEVPKTVMEEKTIEEQKTVMEKETVMRLISASCKELDGWDIVSPDGEKIGSFDDVMLDLQSGRIAYAVISAGSGFLGMGNKTVAIPWDSLTVEGAQTYTGGEISKRMILNISKDQLNNAPDFDKDNISQYSDRTWLSENLYSRYGYHPWWETHYNE